MLELFFVAGNSLAELLHAVILFFDVVSKEWEPSAKLKV